MEEEIMALTQIRVPAADGSGDFGAYLAMPRAGKGPGLVLCQEIFGANETMRSAAENFAEEGRSEEHTSELQSLMRIPYAGFCLTKTNTSTSTSIERPKKTT